MTETIENSKLSIEDLNRAYFAPDNKEAGGIAVEKARAIARACELEVSYNWDAENEPKLPDGYGVAIIPIPERRDGGNVIIGLHIAGIPSPSTILKEEAGQTWAEAALVKVLINKYANAVRPKAGIVNPPTAPFTINDFIISATRESGLAFFREIQAVFVQALKKKGLKLMNTALLKQVLASSQFAEQTFPKITQEIWEGLIKRMIARAESTGVNPGIVKTWLETRASVAFDTADFGLDDIDALIPSVVTEVDSSVA